MSELTAPAPAVGALAPAEDRGVLEVRSRAIEHLVTHAADAVPGTVRSASGLQKLRGRGYPSASVTLRGDRAWVELDVAAGWPCHAERLADNVRRQVHAEAAELSSILIERLDVTLHVLDASDASSSPGRRVL